MTVGDLFSGIGGFSLAATRVFGPDSVRFQVEIDPWCQRVLAKHWPQVKRFGDIREVAGGELEPVTILAGGFPCQDVSGAGSRAGIEGKRSGLWAEYARLIGELRPRYVVVENVTGLLERGMGRVLGDLAGLGYDAEWSVLPACAFGAPHARERVFLVAYPHGERRWSGGDSVSDAPRRAHWQATEGQSEWKDLECWLRAFVPDCHGHSPASRILGVDDGLSARLDPAGEREARIRGLGNAIVPQVAEFLFRRIQEIEAAA